MRRFSLLSLLQLIAIVAVALMVNLAPSEIPRHPKVHFWDFRFGFPLTFALGDSPRLSEIELVLYGPLLINVLFFIAVAAVAKLLFIGTRKLVELRLLRLQEKQELGF